MTHYNKYGQSAPTDRQVQTLCKDFVMNKLYGTETDAMKATLKMQEIWGVRVDWHEFSMALDYLHTIKEIEISKPGGMVGYFIGGFKSRQEHDGQGDTRQD